MGVQIIDTLNKIEPVVLNLSSLMVELNGLVKEARDAANGAATFSQADVDKAFADGVASVHIPETPVGEAQPGFSQEQVDAMIASAIAALPADVTPFAQADLDALEASKNAIIADLEAQVAALKASVPVAGADQDAAQEALADKMAVLIQSLRDLTPSKIVEAQPELPIQPEAGV